MSGRNGDMRMHHLLENCLTLIALFKRSIMKKNFENVVVILFTLFVFSCDNSNPEPKIVAPTDLQVNVVVSTDGSGKVNVDATATGAEYYEINFNENSTSWFVWDDDGSLEHQYNVTGNYTIIVRAHANKDVFTETSKAVEVVVNFIPNTGYTTPDSYTGYTLVWQDEFDGSELDLGVWKHETGTGSNGWGNNELQYYRKENTSIVEGHLVIEAKKESHSGQNYTSSRIVTMGKKSFKYGRVDIRAALPKGQGIWPALWMLGSNFGSVGWPKCGEIDIMELIGGEGKDNVVHGTTHWDNNGGYASYGGSYRLQSGIFADEFHVFSIVWDETKITWYVDDKQFHVIDITASELSEFQQDFFFIFNVAVGGNWPGSPDDSTVFPQRMIVDYVRVFQK